MDCESSSAVNNAGFEKTEWSLVLRAAKDSGTESSEALNRLYTQYWPALYTYVRKKGNSPADAKDLVQGFILKLHERNDLAEVDPSRGKFRTFLKSRMDNFLITDALKRKALKRGGGQVPMPLHVEEAELIAGPRGGLSSEPDAALDQHWGRLIIAGAVHQLIEIQKERGKEELVTHLLPAVMDPDASDYSELAKQLNLSANNIGVTVHRLRHKLAGLVNEEIAKTVGSASEFESEWQLFKMIWSG